MGIPRRTGAWIGLLAGAAAAFTAAPPATANGVDSAGRIVIVPLVMKSPDVESVITVTNTGGERLRISATFFPADGSTRNGVRFCPEFPLEPWASVTQSLEKMCGALSRDIPNLGYLELVSEGDATVNFFASSVISNFAETLVSAVPGQPVGAYEPAWGPGLTVTGLRNRLDETLACYVAALTEPKKVTVNLLEPNGVNLASRQFSLSPRQMVRIDMQGGLGLPQGIRANLRANFQSVDTAPMIAGCAIEEQSRSIGYQAAQTTAPKNTGRLRVVDIDSQLDEGPYKIGILWQHTSAGSPDNLKATMSTYLRANDAVRCYLQKPQRFPAFDATDWLEIQVKAPDGTRIAGGNGFKDTGVFQTGPMGRFPSAAGQRYWIEVSFDEDYEAIAPWMTYNRHVSPGVFSFHCESASGMSEPIGVDIPGNKDDF